MFLRNFLSSYKAIFYKFVCLLFHLPSVFPLKSNPHSTAASSPEPAGRCGTPPWWPRPCSPSPTSSARCASSPSSRPTRTWARCRSRWAACCSTSSSSSSSTAWCCWPSPTALTSCTSTTSLRTTKRAARAFAVSGRTTLSPRESAGPQKLGLITVIYERFMFPSFLEMCTKLHETLQVMPCVFMCCAQY